eukprot:scaffold248384_cov18-Tisochrysis_lutea.AAC.1
MVHTSYLQLCDAEVDDAHVTKQVGGEARVVEACGHIHLEPVWKEEAHRCRWVTEGFYKRIGGPSWPCWRICSQRTMKK